MKAQIQSLTQILCGDNTTNIVRWRVPSPEIHTTLKTHYGALDADDDTMGRLSLLHILQDNSGETLPILCTAGDHTAPGC